MAYTRVWDDSSPPGGTAANLIDDHMRFFRVDVHERMDTLLGAGAWATDPVAAFTGKKLVVPACAGYKGRDAGQFLVANPNGVGFDAPGLTTNVSFYVPLVLPPGVNVTDVSVLSDTSGIGIQIAAHVYGGNARLTSAPDLLTNGSNQLTAITVPAGGFAVGAATNYFVELVFTASNNFAVAYVRHIVVTYDKANILQGF